MTEKPRFGQENSERGHQIQLNTTSATDFQFDLKINLPTIMEHANNGLVYHITDNKGDAMFIGLQTYYDVVDNQKHMDILRNKLLDSSKINMPDMGIIPAPTTERKINLFTNPHLLSNDLLSAISLTNYIGRTLLFDLKLFDSKYDAPDIYENSLTMSNLPRDTILHSQAILMGIDRFLEIVRNPEASLDFTHNMHEAWLKHLDNKRTNN